MDRIRVGSLNDLRATGRLLGKVGNQPVCVFWSDGHAFALLDRCPHMGFPLHRGSIENGLLTCHWHHAQFDLASGGTLDPFADDALPHAVEVIGDDVFVTSSPVEDDRSRHDQRLIDGLEQGLTLVIAKSVLGMLESFGREEGAIVAVRIGVDFGIANRQEGWGAGLTVLTAVANVLPLLDPADTALALTHALAFLSRDTRGHPPRYALSPLDTDVTLKKLSSWYRRFANTRDSDAAERALATALASGATAEQAAELMGAVATDHILLDGGHTIDFTNKAFEILGHLGWQEALRVLPTLAQQTARASRADETGVWRHPDDLVSLVNDMSLNEPTTQSSATGLDDNALDALAWSLLGEDPTTIMAALIDANADGATLEQLARSVAYAAALRMTRFHVQNDHGDWDVVHHGFTAANALHQLIRLAPEAELARGIGHAAMRVYLDRFLNVPPARPPDAASPGSSRDLSELQVCWDREGMVDEAGSVVYSWLRSGGDRSAVIGALGSALFSEDAEFHWFQTYEAGIRQCLAWPADSEQSALILVGIARFLAAHTPTRRELSQVVRIATRLGRGDPIYEEET